MFPLSRNQILRIPLFIPFPFTSSSSLQNSYQAGHVLTRQLLGYSSIPSSANGPECWGVQWGKFEPVGFIACLLITQCAGVAWCWNGGRKRLPGGAWGSGVEELMWRWRQWERGKDIKRILGFRGWRKKKKRIKGEFGLDFNNVKTWNFLLDFCER